MAVYFIKNPATGLIKIGKSFDVANRIKSLSFGYKTDLELLGVIKGSYDEELRLHSQFRARRVAGEWFTPSSNLLEFIASHAISLDELQETCPPKSFVLRSRIGILAKERGLNTTEALSKLTDLTKTTIDNVWSGDIGNRKIRTLYKIAQALQVNMEDLGVAERPTNE